MNKNLILILDNIRSVHNVGSLFRTADGFGVMEIYLCGTTPAPIDRFGRERDDFCKVSLGAEKSVSWKSFETTKEAMLRARELGFELVALEQSSRSTTLDHFQAKEKTALVLGTEVEGLSDDLLTLADTVVEIPMQGSKESFNVSVAGAVAMYQMRKK